MARTVNAYWWTGRPNFGDLLTPLLLERFAHVPVNWAPADEADAVVIGSVLEHMPKGYTGVIAGTGKMFEETPLDLSAANVLALRGPLSAKGIKGNYALGDCALLANELVVVDKTYHLGIVPHWSDKKLEHRPEFQKYQPRIIRPTGDPLEVLREIGRCRKIVTSSLHGAIVADSFGIPRRIELADGLVKEGGAFKFRDHQEALHMKFNPGVTQWAPRFRVQDLQQSLFDVLEEVGALYAD
jgi:pyruvyltransferase